MDTTMQMGLIGSGMGDPTMQQLSKTNGQIGLMGSVSSSALPQQIPIMSQQTQALETVPRDHVPQQFSVSNLQMGRMESQVYGEMSSSSQFFLPNRQSGDLQTMLDNVGTQQSSALTKQKAPVHFTPNIMPTKRMTQVEHRPWLQQVSVPNKLPVQMQSSPTGLGSQHSHLSSKRPASSKPGSLQPSFQKNLSGRMQPSPKSQNELESVRSKLRESLASALALVSQEKNMSSDGKNSKSDTGITPGQKQKSSELPVTGCVGGLNASQETSVNGGNAVSSLRDSSHDLSSNILLRDEDTAFSDSFFVKDELLQGNGLAWVLEPVAEMAETKDVEPSRKQQDLLDIGGTGLEQTTETPETLAVKIEEELFKLHGGVNKKYKEKGRSLVFNLKDRNNPELRERVMRGEISPERLCTMTAEELASKELSEWRMAKAEEMAQMVVLPDSNVDVRRLVRKTHKGEFQVEVEEPDSVSMEVAVGATSQPRVRPISNEKEAPSPGSPRQAKENVKSDVKKSRKAKENVKTNVKRPRQGNENVGSNVQKSSSEQDSSCTLMIPTEGSDLMQGLMGDDELKDLPPIVSLDEFMESLDSEPPFDNLPVDAVKATSDSEMDNSPVHSEPNSPVQNPKDHVHTPKISNSEKVDEVETKSDVGDKSAEKNAKLTTKPSIRISKVDHLWEGLLQLSISTTASVIGIFKSGEKTSVKEWPGSIEIKGRVRLDAFEKFLQHLPMSRSRAVMAVHLVSKEGSPESLSEVADSYVADGRVGLSEPMPGTELYICPPHPKTRQMLAKVLSSHQVDALNDIDNGLVGVVVWRKTQNSSAVSPNSFSHHRHISKRLPQLSTSSSSRQYPEKDSNLNAVNTTPRNALPPPSIPNKPQPEDDDDVPPGFGPPGGRDEDDLPEFNFSTASIPSRPQPSFPNPSRTPSRPTDQIRELIHRYGQPGTTSANWNEKRATRPWDDDDDDMPEWNPDEHQRPQQPQPVHLHSLQPPMLRAHVAVQTAHQQMISSSTMHLQPPVNVGHGPQGAAAPWQQGAWMPPPAAHSHAAYQQPGGGQFSGLPGQQGMAWHSDTPRSRGF